jgi:preprotein translocase subunit SecA
MILDDNSKANGIRQLHESGQPVLVGTISIEKSEYLSGLLKKAGIPHNVLNAKQHEREAHIVAQAGRKGAVTVSTNMAGRGTDILLGGNPEAMTRDYCLRERLAIPYAAASAIVGADGSESAAPNMVLFQIEGKIFQVPLATWKPIFDDFTEQCRTERDEVIALGGLHILGTERHEARRIDNQLRGRSGRQGDPGSSRFYLSLEDDLMRIFAGDKVKNLMDRMGMPDDEPIEHPWVTKSVQNAQRKVEERNFDIRKNLLEYDDVMSAQRKTVYTLRQQLLEGRYHPEEIGDDGKPTGEVRSYAARQQIIDEMAPRVIEVLGMFANPPVRATPGDDGYPKISRERFEGVKMVELEALQREIYQWWGVKIDVDGREDDALGLYDEMVELVPLALTEQRERMLDLADRIVGAMVEESCPPSRTPDDWDWPGIREGFAEHFGVAPGDIEQIGAQEPLARALYDRAFSALEAKEKELGIDLCCRVFRHLYLEEIDRAWVEHLTNMDYLRDGIGLRGYGQKDPKQEYKREGYDLFVNMVATVSSVVVSKLVRWRSQRREEIAAVEEQDLRKHAEQMQAATARHGEDEEAAMAGARLRQAESLPPASKAAVKIGRNDLCPCGSGKKYKKCHGAVDGAADEADNAAT